MYQDLNIKRVINYELPYPLADKVLDELFRECIGNPSEFAKHLYLSPEMVREMAADGMTFGYHTRSHRVLSRLSFQDQLSQLDGGIQFIRELTQQSSIPFCYPYGHAHTYNDNTLRILQSTGYSMAFTTKRSKVQFNGELRFEIPRFDTKDLPPFVENIAING